MIDEVGNRYGRLVVLERTENDRHRFARWLCQCDCGNKIITRGSHLRNGCTRSCGCLQRETFRERMCLPKGEAAFNRLFQAIKRGAKSRDYGWRLTKKEFRRLTKQNCHYCGAEPAQEIGRVQGCNGTYIYNGVDRIDNALGYLSNNVVPCCWVCNQMKSTMSVEKFESQILKIAEYIKNRKVRRAGMDILPGVKASQVMPDMIADSEFVERVK